MSKKPTKIIEDRITYIWSEFQIEGEREWIETYEFFSRGEIHQ